jgi:Alpha-galactosidase, CBM13 domain
LVGGHRSRLAGKGRFRRIRPWTIAAVGVLVVVLSVILTKAGGSGTRSDVVDGPTHARATETAVDIPAEPPLDTGNPAPGAPAAPASGTNAASPVGTAPAPRPAPSKAAPPAPPPPPTVITSYEAESSANSLAGTKTFTCDGCSGGKKVGNIGRGMGTLQFNGIDATSGPISVTLVYVNGEGTRTAQLSVNGGAPTSLNFPFTGGWSTVGTLDVTVPARTGANTLRFFNTVGPAPDFDRIVVTVPGR